ncbi:MAG: hypothetical protein OXC62_14265 [Aestuariivita sp.]|nr:hypothetical protein [Aestuariivita sp.]
MTEAVAVMWTSRMYLGWVLQRCSGRITSVPYGLEAALQRKELKNCKNRILDKKGEATLTMLACSPFPEGQA